MNIQKIGANLALCALVFGATAGAVAQDHHDDDKHRPQDRHDQHDQRGHDQRDQHGPPHKYVRHNEWRKGARMNRNDWNRGQRVDYRAYHLNAPPRGYEWREVDGNYVLAAVATGVIANVIANALR